VESVTGACEAEKTKAASICNKSAITDHVCNKNPVTDRDNVKVIDRESDKTGRLMREAIWIWNSKNVKQDDESYQLSQVWDKLLTPETELSPDEDL